MVCVAGCVLLISGCSIEQLRRFWLMSRLLRGCTRPVRINASLLSARSLAKLTVSFFYKAFAKGRMMAICTIMKRGVLLSAVLVRVGHRRLICQRFTVHRFFRTNQLNILKIGRRNLRLVLVMVIHAIATTNITFGTLC